MRFVSAPILLCFGIWPLCAPAFAASTFDTNDEGWSGLTADIATSGIPMQTSSSLTYHATAGNPGGYVSTLDPDAFDTFFRAPASFLGDQSSAVGGSLSFDTITDLAIDYNGADVVIKGNGTVLAYDIAPTASNAWSTVSVALVPGPSWRLNTLGGPVASLADFQNALANVSELWITAEYHAGIAETTGLDNIALTAVPEPAAIVSVLLCWGSGLVLSSRHLRSGGRHNVK